jgi:hypothetical protein
MLKSWLRDLPTELIPKTLQSELAAKLAKENPDYQKVGQQAPETLKQALSNLPPYNYYVLFAITCHLSLLLNNQEKNKMDLNNLSICIGPCLDLERWLFNYLVGDWRRCWEGCATEKAYEKLEKEGAEIPETNFKPPVGAYQNFPNARSESNGNNTEERAIYSSGRGSSRSRAPSTSGSRYEDARSTQHSPQNSSDSIPPALPQLPSMSHFGKANASTPKQSADTDQRRPATAGKSSETSSTAGTPTPKPVHNRSKSDYQISPVKPSSPMDYPFPFPREQ